MSDFINNLEYLYEHLPGRYRVADEGQDYLLKRFLQPFGEELDRFDELHESLPDLVSPYTAPPEWVDFMLDAFFGWSFFPEWFTDEERLFFLQDIAQLYAKRGTPEGIEELLLRFGIRARVIRDTPGLGEFTLGQDHWLLPGPLGFVVEILPEAGAAPEDLAALGEFTVGESHVAVPSRSVERVDLDMLLRFMRPLGQVIAIRDLRGPV
jgi:phage tail-like protein